METVYIYIPDIVKVINLLKTVPEKNTGAKLNIKRNIINQELLPIEYLSREREIIEKPAIPSIYQIRYRQWNIEQKLLVDSSRYIKPITSLKVYVAETPDKGDLILPEYKRQPSNTDWLTIILVIVLLLFATVRNSFSKYLANLFKSIFNYQVSFRMFREKNNASLQASFRLEVYFYIVFAIFLFQCFNYYQFIQELNNFMRFTLSLGGVIGYFLLKKMVYSFLDNLIKKRTETNEYLFNMDNFNRVLGLVLFPIVSLIAFYPFNNINIPIISGLFLMAVFYIFLLQRGILILMKKQFSIFYLFLYLCTLEILPLLLIYLFIVLR